MCLGMTHEEVIAWLASRRSARTATCRRPGIRFRQAARRSPSEERRAPDPGVRDEGLLQPGPGRGRPGGPVRGSAKAYCRIFERCGVKYSRGGERSRHDGRGGLTRVHGPSPAGEDQVALCGTCGYAANLEMAVPVSPSRRFRRVAGGSFHAGRPDDRRGVRLFWVSRRR